jgi:putative nucleotidyltransferase with HDIG domain
MAAWWILLLVAIAVIVAVIDRDQRGTWFLAGRRSTRRRARRPVARASTRPAGRPVSAAPVAAFPSPLKDPVAPGASPLVFPELSGLEPAPERIDRPWDEPPDPTVLSLILGCAAEVLDRVAARRLVLEAISSPSSDPRALTDVVVSDPALSVRVLRTVNSPFYGLRQPMASVFRAVLYLGHNEVRNIIWRACVAEATGELPGPAGEILDATWRHSFIVSRVAYALARALGVPQPDTVATTALLHDAGKLVVTSVVPEKAVMIYRPSRFGSASQLRREWELVGVGHGLLGGEVVRAWGLPAEVAVSVAQHHLPSFLSSDHAKGDARLVGVVHLADLLCHAFARADAEEVVHLPAAGWLSDLGVKGDLSTVCDATVLRALRSGAGGFVAAKERAA